jgi:hypothetical protein
MKNILDMNEVELKDYIRRKALNKVRNKLIKQNRIIKELRLSC